MTSEFLGLVGLPLSIGIVGATIWGFFTVLEQVIAPATKKTLTGILRADWTVLPKRFPIIIRQTFEAIFGANHLSAKCFGRSVLFSVSAILILSVLGFINHYSYFRTMPGYVYYKPSYRIIFFGWFVLSVCIDYFNLFKTRIVIRLIERTSFYIAIFFIFIALDLALSFLIFVIAYEFLDVLNMSFQVYEICREKCPFWETMYSQTFFIFQSVIGDINYFREKLSYVIAGPTATEIGVFFWAGLLPTLWLLIYGVATTITRLLLKVAGPISQIFSWLDIDKPFQSIGFIAASIVCISMIVFALVTKIT